MVVNHARRTLGQEDGGHARVRRVRRAQILLAAEQGHGDEAVAATVGVGTSTVYRTKRRFVEGGEIEIGVLVEQCLDRRIADRDTLRRGVASWPHQRNTERARVKWLFDVRRAREILGRVYPKPLSNELAHAA